MEWLEGMGKKEWRRSTAAIKRNEDDSAKMEMEVLRWARWLGHRGGLRLIKLWGNEPPLKKDPPPCCSLSILTRPLQIQTWHNAWLYNPNSTKSRGVEGLNTLKLTYCLLKDTPTLTKNPFEYLCLLSKDQSMHAKCQHQRDFHSY